MKTVQQTANKRSQAAQAFWAMHVGDAELERDDAHALCRGDETLEVQPVPLTKSD